MSGDTHPTCKAATNNLVKLQDTQTDGKVRSNGSRPEAGFSRKQVNSERGWFLFVTNVSR